jgi:DNA (cytosine-5)-methyltransferase 1
VGQLERLGYAWAYRVIDSRAFGLPQRRMRVFLLASRVGAPGEIILGTDAEAIVDPRPRDIVLDGKPVGFYWTEGNRGGGWAEHAVPALKPGSARGIPSPPAVLLPGGFVGVPRIEDAERLQGFPRGWTAPASSGGRQSHRWRLVGNAVSVPVAKWIGMRLKQAGMPGETDGTKRFRGAPWPKAAWGKDGKRFAVQAGPFPVRWRLKALAELLTPPLRPLSGSATGAFADRLQRSHLTPPQGFLKALRAHARNSHTSFR